MVKLYIPSINIKTLKVIVPIIPMSILFFISEKFEKNTTEQTIKLNSCKYEIRLYDFLNNKKRFKIEIMGKNAIKNPLFEVSI
jgi:hypothetical protein